MKRNNLSFRFAFGIFVVTVAISTKSYSQTNEGINPSKNEPKVHIDVKKEFDDQGNVIRYDSTYTWSWSSSGSPDSIPGFNFSFRQGNGTSPFGELGMNPFNDSLFFNTDPFNFSFNMEDIEKQMEEQLKQMEEFQKQFYTKPEEIIPQNNNQNNQTTKNKGISL